MSEDPDLAAAGSDAVGLAEVTDLTDVAELDADVDPGDVDLAEDVDAAELEDLDVDLEVEVDVVEADEDAADEEPADEDDAIRLRGPAARAAKRASGGGCARPPGRGHGVAEAAAKPAEEEAFVYGDDDDDLPAAQVASAGATADPVKDYLKQIGKVPLLNAEQEVELAKRIEAGLFAEEKLAEGMDGGEPAGGWTWSGSPRMAAGPRTTCWRLTCGWLCRWPSGIPAAACCSWT